MNKISILIVEDEIALRETWQELLCHFNFEPLIASNGHEAIRILNSNSVDVVITDLQMPLMNGYLLLDYMKNNNLDIMTIICSGQIKTKALDQYKIHQFINKPFNMVEIIQKIETEHAV